MSLCSIMFCAPPNTTPETKKKIQYTNLRSFNKRFIEVSETISDVEIQCRMRKIDVYSHLFITANRSSLELLNKLNGLMRRVLELAPKLQNTPGTKPHILRILNQIEYILLWK